LKSKTRVKLKSRIRQGQRTIVSNIEQENRALPYSAKDKFNGGIDHEK